jgi:hypothetical protein
MAQTPNNFDKQKLKKDFDESIAFMSDGISSLGAQLSAVLDKSFKEMSSGAEKNVLGNIWRKTNSAFAAVKKELDNVVITQKRIEEGELSYNQVVARGSKVKEKIAILEARRNELQLHGRDLTKEQVKDLKEYTDELVAATQAQTDLAAEIEDKAGAIGQIFTRMSNTPVIGQLLNAKAATEAMRKSLAGGGSALKSLGLGLKQLLKGLGPVAIALAAFEAIQGLVQTMFRASKQTKELAVNLGVSMKAAKAFKEELLAAAGANDGIFYTTEELLKTYGLITKTQGIFTSNIAQQAVEVNFLTQGLGIAGENAVNLSNIFENQGSSSRLVFDNIAGFAQEFQKTTGLALTARQIFSELGETSSGILANFANNPKELAKAVGQVRRFGVSLTQAKNIANGLLDFEQSIGAELEAEILLGKQFNFERARAAAATGDIATATQEVLKQTQNLTDEQLRSPLIQEAIAKATGLSVDELFSAREITKKLNLEQDEYNKLLKKGSNIIGNDAMMRLMREKDSSAAVEATLDAQEKFNRALEAAKDQFAGLVGSGVLDFFTSALPGIIRGLTKMFGSREDVERMELQQDLAKKLNAENETRSKENQIDVREAIAGSNQVFDEYWKARTKIKDKEFVGGAAQAALEIGSVNDNQAKILNLIYEESKKTNNELGKSAVLNIDSNGVMQKFVETNYK